MGLPAGQVSAERVKLRNEAIAAMVLFDVEEERSWEIDGEWTNSLDFSPDYQMFAQSNRRGDIRIYPVDGENDVVQFAGRGQRAWELQLSPDARFLASRHSERANTPGAIHVWSVQSPEQPIITVDTDSKSGCGRFFADHRLYAVEQPNRVDLYSLSTGSLVKKLTEVGQVNSLLVSADDKSIAFFNSTGQTIEIWSISGTPKRQTAIDLPQGIQSMCWDSRRQILVAAMTDGKISVWRHGYDRPPETLETQQYQVERVRIHPHEPRIACGGFGNLRVHDLTSKTRFFFDVRDDGLFAVVGLQKQGRSALIDLSKNLVRHRFGSHPSITAVAISNDGKWVATGTWRGYGVRVWNAITGELVREFLPKSPSTTLAFTPDSSMLFAVDSDGLHLWRCATWQPVPHQMRRDTHPRVGLLCFSRDGFLLVVNKSDYTPQIFSFRSKTMLANSRGRTVDGRVSIRLARAVLSSRCPASVVRRFGIYRKFAKPCGQ